MAADQILCGRNRTRVALNNEIRAYKNIPETKELISLFDVLVDGPYVEALKDIRLKFRGSSNQRVIDVQNSLKENKCVLYLD